MRSSDESVQQIDKMVASFAKRLPIGAIVLDLGCGPGLHTVALARLGMHVTGIDYASAMLDRARRRLENANLDAEFRVADLDRPLPFETESVDGAVCVSVLQVLDDPGRFLTDLRNVIKPGGVVVFEQVRHWGALSSGENLGMKDRLVNATKVAVAKRNGNVRRLTAEDITQLCTTRGFEVLDEHTYDKTFTVTVRRD
jgi:ubiquinone/menaquinone biosynthesis C-methylase UbiE